MFSTAQVLAQKEPVAKVVLLFILLLSVFAAKNYILASLDYYQARQIVAGWHQSSGPESLHEFQTARAAMMSANDLDKNNPLYLDLLAQIMEWEEIEQYEDSNNPLDQAKLLYLRSTHLRPTWSVTWASLALLKWRQAEFDQEMLTYMQRASILGPSQPEVHVMFVELGLALYKADHPYYLVLAEEMKKRLYLGLSHPQSVERVKSAIIQHDATTVTCRWLRDKSRFIRAKVGCLH